MAAIVKTVPGALLRRREGLHAGHEKTSVIYRLGGRRHGISRTCIFGSLAGRPLDDS